MYEELFDESDARVHEFVERVSRGMEREEKCRSREDAQEQRSRDEAVKKRTCRRPGEDGGDDVDVAAENEEEDLEDLPLRESETVQVEDEARQ